MKTKLFWTAAALIAGMHLSAQSPEEAVNFMQDETGVGVRAQAMAGAFAGLGGDVSALYWNPAGLAKITATEITGDLSHLRFRNEARFTGDPGTMNRDITRFKSFGLAYRFPTERGSFVVAFGYDRFKDYENGVHFSGFNTKSNGIAFDIETDEDFGSYAFDRDVSQTEDLYEEGYLGAWSAGFGIAMSERFSLGAAFHSITGSSQYLLDFTQEDVENSYGTYPADFNRYEVHQDLASRFTGWGASIGGLFELSPNLRLGVGADLPTSLAVKETYADRDALTYDDGTVSEADLGSGVWEYRVRYPVRFRGGVALDLGKLLLAGAYEFRDWRQVKFEPAGGDWFAAEYSGLLGENAQFHDKFRAVLSYGAGAELRVPGTGIALRGGFRNVPSPLAGAGRDLDRTYVSGGLGFDVDRSTSIHLAYIRGLWNRSSEDSYTPGVTEERIETRRFLAGLTLRF
jgi:long-subunit fatty acid transport protein